MWTTNVATTYFFLAHRLDVECTFSSLKFPSYGRIECYFFKRHCRDEILCSILFQRQLARQRLSGKSFQGNAGICAAKARTLFPNKFATCLQQRHVDDALEKDALALEHTQNRGTSENEAQGSKSYLQALSAIQLPLLKHETGFQLHLYNNICRVHNPSPPPGSVYIIFCGNSSLLWGKELYLLVSVNTWNIWEHLFCAAYSFIIITFHQHHRN